MKQNEGTQENKEIEDSLAERYAGGEMTGGVREALKKVSNKTSAFVPASFIPGRGIDWSQIHFDVTNAALAVQSQTGVCESETPGVISDVVSFLNDLQQIGVAIGVGAAGVGYVAAGILWITGKPQRAYKLAVQVTGGLLLVLISGGLVGLVEDLLCGVG